MLEDLQLKGYAPATQAQYVGAVRQLARFYHKSPDLLSEAELRAYWLHLTQDEIYSTSTLNTALAGLKFFFVTTLQRPWPVLEWARVRKQVRLPVVLSRPEVGAILKCVRVPVYRVCLQTIYSCGLRISEAVGLQVGDVDSQRMVLRVRGKGNKERQVPLAQPTLAALRQLWKAHRSRPWLFPQGLRPHWGSRTAGPIQAQNVRRAFQLARLQSGVTKPACVHSLRHSYATHLLEAGVQLLLIQEILGHRSPRTTTIYTHLTDQVRAQVIGPVQALVQDL
jgi:site-specific recombinase XerD